MEDKNRLEERACPSRMEMGSIYDMGIEACDARDKLELYRVIDTLRGLKDLQNRGVASWFCRLYDYCLRSVNDNNFEDARNVMYELHQSWNTAVFARHSDRGGNYE